MSVFDSRCRASAVSWLLLLFFASLADRFASAQNDAAHRAAQATTYGASFGALGEQFSVHANTKGQLIKQREEIQRGLFETENDLQQVNARELVNQMRQAESLLAQDSMMAQAQSLQESTSKQKNSYQKEVQKRTVSSLQRKAFNEQLRGMNLQNQFQQLDAAARLIVERRQKLLLSYQDVAQRAQAWMVADYKFIEQYADLADIGNTRSRSEQEAARDELSQLTPDNYGGMLAKAIAHVRLEEYAEAQKTLDELLSAPNNTRPVALAVRGELLVRKGDKDAAKKSFTEALRLNPSEPRVRWIHAQTMAYLKDSKSAVSEWTLLLKSSQFEIAAHRGLALTHCALSPEKPRSQKEALEHANLANSLAGESDWSCQIALALATAISGDMPAAITLAEEAAENAIDDRKEQCLKIVSDLKSGTIPVWQF